VIVPYQAAVDCWYALAQDGDRRIHGFDGAGYCRWEWNASSVAEAVPTGDRLLMLDNTRLVALDARTGTECWRVTVPGPRLWHVFVGTDWAWVVAATPARSFRPVGAFRLSDGKELWPITTALRLRYGTIFPLEPAGRGVLWWELGQLGNERRITYADIDRLAAP
jgi:outer membrane protein assembly factor BamB